MARLAAIDIGSNALRLRIVEVDAPTVSGGAADGETARFHAFRDVFVDRVPVRLGHDVFTKGRLATSVIGAACDALRRFRTAMDAAKVDRYRAVATSAAREAQNGDVFVERAEREAGIHVEVIEGIEEARLVQLAVRERLAPDDRNVLLVDIGGGSTELTLLRGRTPLFTRSLPIGTVRLVESFLDGGGPVGDVELRILDEYLDRSFVEAVPEILALTGGRVDLLVGTGGNIETLAELCPVPSAFPEARAIDVAAMIKLVAELAKKSVDQRASEHGLRPDRADTIVPAAVLLARLSQKFDRASIAAPGVGLKEGVLVDLARAHFLDADVGSEAMAALTDACVRLGRRYHFDEQHGQIVAGFAVRLFADLAPRHRMGARDRMLLHAAALLHDVGDYVRYEAHHKHSFYLIQNSDLMGVSPVERAVIANVARYHRKSHPSPDHDNFRALSREDRGRVKALAAILRVADALDREHLGKVTEVSGRIEGDTFVLTAEGSEDRALEEWTVRAKSGLLRDAFGLDVKLLAQVDPAKRATDAPPSARPSQRG
ncbi:MAG TPA: Ppx/GppA phosphatase family protein [Byssovorax sp.]|jgi:exopolyphosphatase/guanosine-5'-triphosphate,3'-diphosphate pyrophosphatase